jgi:hypothetical protein
MAISPVPQWAQEMSPHHRGPTASGVLALAVLAVLVALVLQLGAVTDRGGNVGKYTPTSKPPPCARHWPPTCEEGSRGR